MGSRSISILVADLADDTLADVSSRLLAFGEDHLVDDFVVVDVSGVTTRATPAIVAGRDEPEDDLYEVLGYLSVDIVRVCAVVHSDQEEVLKTTAVADEIIVRLTELSPPGVVIKSIRIWAGDDGAVFPVSYTSPEIDANLVVIPEDRASGAQFGVPIRVVDSSLFVESLAVELATQLGLWVGMVSAPVDDATVGVIGYGSAKIYFVRSFVRIAAGPSVPIAPILVDDGRALLPGGCIETADPTRFIDELAGRARHILKPLSHVESQRPVADRVERSIGDGLGTVGRSIGDYVGNLPSRIARGTMEDLTELAGQVTQDIVGNSSIIEIVWRDQVDHDESTPYANLADKIAEDTQSDIDLRGGVASDPRVWVELNDLVSGAIDGGEIPSLDLASDGALIPVISEVDRIVRAPQATLEKTIDWVLPDRLGDSTVDQDAAGDIESDEAPDEEIVESEATLIDRIDDVLNVYRNSHTETLNRRISEMVTALRSLRLGPPIGIAIGGGVSAFVGMLLIVQAIIFSGLADQLGIYGMSVETRDTAWAIGSVIALLVLVVAAYVGFQSSGTWSSAWPPLVAAGLAATLGGFAAQAMTIFGAGASSREIWGAAVTLAILVGAPVLSATLWLQGRRWKTAGQMARVAYVAWIGYFGFILVGIVVRPGGWWDDDHGNLLIYLFLVTMLLLVMSIVITGYMEFRYRNRLRSAIDEIAWFEKEIISAVQTRAATDEALEQFKAFSATWSYIVWNPAGKVTSISPEMPGLAEMSVLKASFLTFGLTERGEQELRNSTRNEISKIGWLKDQYELAVAAFQNDDRIRMGAASSVRPDQDARPIAAVDEARRVGLSSRWRFAEAMVSSELDYALLERFDELEPLSIYEEVLGDRRNLAMASEDSSSIGEFFLALRQGEDVEIAPSQLTVQGRKETKLPDRILRSQVWWPEVSLPGVVMDDEVDECALATSRESVVVIAVRSDWAGPFVPEAVSDLAAPPDGDVDDSDDDDDWVTPDV